MQDVIAEEINVISESLAKTLGQQRFQVWFGDSSRMTLTSEHLDITVPNLFAANWLEKHFSGQISQAVLAATGGERKLTFTVKAELAGRRAPAESPAPQPAALRQYMPHEPLAAKKPPRSDKVLRLTIDTFVKGPSNELAYNAAIAVANEVKSPFNPLFIHGGYGVGKTHLLQGICNAVCKNRPGTNWLYLSAEDFANQFVLALKTRKLEAFRRRMRQTDLLAIDDIHFLASKPATQEEFLHTFNGIDLAGKQVVLVCDSHPKMIKQLSDKLVNRFISGMVVKIEPPDFQTRCKICKQYVDSANGQIPEPVIKYVAENLRDNVRELEGALLKIMACSSLQSRKITLETAQQILSEYLIRPDRVVHISAIESAVASYFEVASSTVHSPKKDRTATLARHFCMYLVRKHTRLSFPEIGRMLGNKNHATVLLACRGVDEQIKQNADLHWHGSSGNRICKAKTVLDELEQGIRN